MIKRFLILGVLIGIVVFLPACGKNAESPPEQLKYRLKWLFNISVVGDLWADVKGNFEQKGLTVIIKPGGPEKDAIKELELGHAHFGVASADQIIRALSKGSPVVVLAQLFQDNPLQWIYRPEKTKIDSPADLKGKTIGVTFGGNDETIMNALLARYDIGKDEVRLFSVRYDYTPFYQGKVDLWPVYRNAEGVVIEEKLRKAGEQIAFLNPDDAGIEFVANSVITTENMMAKYPETVADFMEALLSAWKKALDPVNSQEAVQIVKQFDRDTPQNIITKQLMPTRLLMIPSGDYTKAGKLGIIDFKAWQQTEDIMLKQKLVEKPVKIEKRLYTGFVSY